MTKADQKFITEALNRLEKKIDKNSEEIRFSGVLIEKMQDKIDLLHEGHKTMLGQMSAMQDDITEIKTTIYDYPVLRETVKKHSRQLAKMGS